MAELDISSVTRLEIIDEGGRKVIFWDKNKKVYMQLQDNDKTLKMFVEDRIVEPNKPQQFRKGL